MEHGEDRFRDRLLSIGFFLLFCPAACEASSFFPPSAFSDNAAGTTAAPFLKLPTGARAEALGGSFAAAADNSEAVFWNPAGLTHLDKAGRSDAGLSYNAFLQSSYASALSYARSMGDAGVLGLGALYFSPGTLQGYTILGDPSSSFTPNDFEFLTTYARKFRGVSFGSSLKVIHSELADASGTTFAADLGVQAQRVTELEESPLDIGFSILHLGPSLHMGGAADPLPMKLQFGTLWHMYDNLGVLLDGHMPVDQAPYVSFGLEGRHLFSKTFAGSLRGGFDLSHIRNIDGFTGFSFGMGLELQQFRIDYAWVPFGDLGSTNRISLGFMFGGDSAGTSAPSRAGLAPPPRRESPPDTFHSTVPLIR